MTRTGGRLPFVAVHLLVLVGCGNNQSEIPPELLEAIRASERGSGTGTEVGDVAENFCFEGWNDPAAANFDPLRLEPICLYDFRDPDGERGELLLVNAAAIWCVACRSEYSGSRDRRSLSEHLEARRDQGFRILGTLFQDAEGNPATAEDAVAWARQFGVDFPFALDEAFQLGAFTTPSQAPFNMLIDARTMEIVLQLEGDQPAVLFTTVDRFLAERSASGK